MTRTLPDPGATPGGTSSEPTAHQLHVRTASFRIPGMLGLVLALPILLVFGAVALGVLVATLAALAVAPAFAGRTDRPIDRGAEGTITLDETSYRRVDDAPALPVIHTPRRNAPPSRPS